jgi:hypothetical protein
MNQAGVLPCWLMSVRGGTTLTVAWGADITDSERLEGQLRPIRICGGFRESTLFTYTGFSEYRTGIQHKILRKSGISGR